MTRTGEGLLQTWTESKYPVSSPSLSREPHPRLGTGEGLLQTWTESKYPVSSPSLSGEPHPRLRQGRVRCRPGQKVSTLSPHPHHPESHTRDSDRGRSAADLDGK